MPAIKTPKEMKQTVEDLEAAILSLCEVFEEATGFQVSIINTYVGGDDKRKVKVTVWVKS